MLSRITVIIPTYNEFEVLKECLSHLYDQGIDDLNIYIIISFISIGIIIYYRLIYSLEFTLHYKPIYTIFILRINSFLSLYKEYLYFNIIIIIIIII